MAEQSKQPQTAVAEAMHLLQTFRGADLTQTIYQIEKSLKGVSAQNYSAVLTTSGAKAEVLGAAGLLKQLAGQTPGRPRIAFVYIRMRFGVWIGPVASRDAAL